MWVHGRERAQGWAGAFPIALVSLQVTHGLLGMSIMLPPLDKGLAMCSSTYISHTSLISCLGTHLLPVLFLTITCSTAM